MGADLSTDGSAGEPDAGIEADGSFPDLNEEAGCGCRVGSTQRGPAGSLLGLLGLLMLASWRARHRR
jgi:MYXO-CTERM domain-containing protein